MGSHRPWALVSPLFHCLEFLFITAFFICMDLPQLSEFHITCFTKIKSMAAKSHPAGLERQISSTRERNYTTSAFWVYEDLMSDGFQQAKQGYCVDSKTYVDYVDFQDSQTNRHKIGTTWHYLTKSTLLPVWSPALPGVGWLIHALSRPHHTASLGTAFLLLPGAATFQIAPTGIQRAKVLL